jgi:oxygen-independent coproporphyrinogen-3 oxidase
MSCSTWSISAARGRTLRKGNVRNPTKKSNTPAGARQLTQQRTQQTALVPSGQGRPGLAAPAGRHIYVHFPWCLAKCPYCDFVSYATGTAGVADLGPLYRKYTDAVLREIEARAEALQPVGGVAGAEAPDEARAPGSVFFGGGTPSRRGAREVGRVLGALSDAEEATEVTVECNPTSIDEERARALLDAGVNRLSIGVQSLSDERLRFLGRLHDARGGLDAVRGALRAGVRRVSADLIFGLPGQTPEQACEEATRLLDLGLEHLSCYQLTIEQGTRFGELARRGRLPLAEDAAVAESFLALDEAISARGLAHYEISNYARPGQEAQHNLGYWRGHEYVGLGCAAYGFLRPEGGGGGGVRYRNEVVPERYLEGAPSSEEPLAPDALMRERIMLGLRTRDGVDLDEAEANLGVAGCTPARERAVAWLVERGRLVAEGGTRLSIPAASWLWADDTAARLF